MEQNKYDLIAILKVLMSKIKLVTLISTLGLIASVIFVSVRKDVYTSEVNLIVKSYMNFDRNQMFSEEAFYVKDVFAKENEIDKAMTILENSDVIGHMAAATNYEKVKSLKPSQVHDAVKSSYKVKRTDNSDLEIKFTDTDPAIAHRALLAALQKSEDMYRNYFEEFNLDVSKEIEFKTSTIKDSIATINQSMVALRKQHNIYNALTPTRGTTTANSASVTETNAVGMEELQSLAAVKDRLDQQLAKLTALKSQYNSFLNAEKMRFFYKVSGPYEPKTPSNVPAIWIILGSVIAAFIFSCFWVLLENAYKNRA